MINTEIIKTNLFHEELSEDTLKLARAIYNTHIENRYYLNMSIKLIKIYALLNIEESIDSLNYIKTLFMELNEPIFVKNFTYKHKTYSSRFFIFCTYSFSDTSVELLLNEEYLEVEANYMLDAFLSN
ncbi:MAG: hypothetical protein L3I99_03040 [Sulfurimonas sp.]|nr:hypothetical protein [Sulfurimonas sp.]